MRSLCGEQKKLRFLSFPTMDNGVCDKNRKQSCSCEMTRANKQVLQQVICLLLLL
jgi:hypothetical protein